MVQKIKPPTEYVEQVRLVKWLTKQGWKFTAIPNSTWTPGYAQINRNRASGVRSGMTDLIIIVPIKGLVFLELKREKGGHVSDEQQEWVDALNAVGANVEAVIMKGADAAIKYLETYVQQPKEEGDQERSAGRDSFNAWLEGTNPV